MTTAVVKKDKNEKYVSLTEISFRKFLKNKLAVLGLFIITILVLLSVCAPLLTDYTISETDLFNIQMPPSKDHILGTDDLGRDVFTRLIYGGRVSILVGIASMTVQLLIGVTLGALAGYFGGIVDKIVMRIIDVIMCFPFFVIAVSVAAITGPGVKNLIIIIGFLMWPNIARIVRAETLSVKEREYVLYAKSIGQSSFRIISKHIIPSILPTVIVASSINIASAILMESSLSFLGLGVQQPNASWGSMLKDAQGFLADAPHMALFPGIFILLTVLSFNLIGDTLRSVFEAKANDR
jgi:peptide/nickel transport system permease protein